MQAYAIFGVVDPALQAQISQLNLAFNSAGKVERGEAKVIVRLFNEAASSLVQAALAYELKNEIHRNADPGTTYVVMAQMTPDIAAGLARDLTYRAFTYKRLVHPFDVIVSAADVYSHTPPGSTSTGHQRTPCRIPVITPHPLLLPDSSGRYHLTPSENYPLTRITNPFETLTISNKLNGKIKMTVDVDEPPDQSICNSSDFFETPGLSKYLKPFDLGQEDECQNTSTFECAVLTSYETSHQRRRCPHRAPRCIYRLYFTAARGDETRRNDRAHAAGSRIPYPCFAFREHTQLPCCSKTTLGFQPGPIGDVFGRHRPERAAGDAWHHQRRASREERDVDWRAGRLVHRRHRA